MRGLEFALPVVEGCGPPISTYEGGQRDVRLRRCATAVLRGVGCDYDRLAAAIGACVIKRIERAGCGVPAALDGYAAAVEIGEATVALLRRRDADAPGPARNALRAELEDLMDATQEHGLEDLWGRPSLHWRLGRQFNTSWSAHSNRGLPDWGWLEHHSWKGGVERITIHLGSKNSKPGGPSDVVRMYYMVCHLCRRGLIGKLAVNRADWERLGLASHAIRHLMHGVPGYTWYTSVQYDTARSFWELMGERTGAGFTGPGSGVDVKCEHMREA